jgi:hypothetical protein
VSARDRSGRDRTVERVELRASALTDARSNPSWLDTFVTTSNLAVLAFGSVALVLAVAGLYRGWLAVCGGLAVTAALAVTGRASGHASGRARRPRPRVAEAIAAAVIAFVVLTTAYSFAHGAQHVAINRDPGFYVNAGRWIARDGSLEVDVDHGPFATAPSLGYQTPGLNQRDDTTLHFQGNHFLPALLAVGHSVAGDAGLFALPTLLGALALVTLYAFAAPRAGPLPAAAITVALGGSALWIAFARDAYSEIPSLMFALFALTRLPAAGDAPRPREALHAGLAFGALVALRIDAPLLLFGVPLVVASWWRRASTGEARAEARRAAAAIAAGFATTATIGIIDLMLRSRDYLGDLADRTAPLWIVLAGLCAASATVCGAAAGRRLLDRVVTVMCTPASRHTGAALILVAGAALWFVRPRIQTVRGPAQDGVVAVQRIQGIAVDATRKYAEHAFEWQAWYLGPALVLLAIAGLAIATIDGHRGRPLLPLVLTAAPASLLYLRSPNIFPDHTWVMRRYLTTLTPLLLVAAAVALGSLAAALGRSTRVVFAQAAVAAVAVLAVSVPLWSVRPIRAAADQAGYLDGVERGCEALGDDGAAIVLKDERSALYKLLPQALRGWCGVPVAIGGRSLTPSVVASLERLWDAAGVTLHLVAAGRADAQRFCGDAVPVEVRAFNPFLLEQTLTRRPSHYQPQSLDYIVYRADRCTTRP